MARRDPRGREFDTVKLKYTITLLRDVWQLNEPHAVVFVFNSGVKEAPDFDVTRVMQVRGTLSTESVLSSCIMQCFS